MADRDIIKNSTCAIISGSTSVKTSRIIGRNTFDLRFATVSSYRNRSISKYN